MESAEEEHAVDEVIDRLARRFPDIPRDHVVTVVRETHLELEGNPIRDFVPVLVEHTARKRLREEAKPEPVGVDDVTAARVPKGEPVELDPLEIERRTRERKSGLLFGDLGGGPS